MEKYTKFLKTYKGLDDNEIKKSALYNGKNTLEGQKKDSIFLKIINIIKEPMFLLLIIAASIYFIVGEYTDGIIMLFSVLGICAIEYYQERQTEKALDELNKLSSTNVKVIRNSEIKIVTNNDLVVGDIVILEEGDKIPADGEVLFTECLGVNESLLTGETDTQYKTTKNDDSLTEYKCYYGTNVVTGMGIIKITSVGKNTEIGKIGTTLNKIIDEKTLLERQVRKVVFICTLLCFCVFILTILINFFTYSDLIFEERLVNSIISGITIAMATIPEEIPVVLTVFLAIGAWDLSKKNILTKNSKTVECLGTINVLCTDKTGTITENKMKVIDYYKYSDSFKKSAYLACPNVVYDPMEIAIKEYFGDKREKSNLKIKKIYPFTSKIKMMGLLWDNNTMYIKGAYESVLKLCKIKKKDKSIILNEILKYSKTGNRIIAVAKSIDIIDIPKSITDVNYVFEGLIILEDPIRDGIENSIKTCDTAGIRVIMITGDNGETAKGIAKKIGIKNPDSFISGSMIEKMSDEELTDKVKSVNIFARVYPEHKMKIINALQKENNIVAMTGDGINDAPALKKANVGIAMGKRGTNVAKEAADLILLDDNFNTIVEAIKNGRGIYDNIKKAISYILVIHIPVALLALFVPIFKLPPLLVPIHILLLELLIDPTSSIIFQRFKPDENIMQKEPRNINEKLLSGKTLSKNIIQGLFIFVISFLNYYYLVKNNIEIGKCISITYSILVLSIIFVAFNLKDEKSSIYNFINSFKDKITLTINFLIILGLISIIYLPFFNSIANTMPLQIKDIIYILIVTFITVLPFDMLKYIEQIFSKNNTQ